MKTPHDPTAATRSWTDAFPVSDRDADALDAWLEQQSAIARAGASSTPVESPGFDHNGQTSAAASNGTFPLTATAQRFHARLQDAERDHAPDVPEAAIWEKVMSNHLALEPTLPAARTGRIRGAKTHLRAADVPSPHPIQTFVGSNPAISAIFAIAVMIAIITVFRGMSEHGAGPVPTAPTGGESHLAAITNATPEASATAQASDCVVRVLTEQEAAQVVAKWQAAPPPAYLPIQGAAPAQDADAASLAYVKLFTCPSTTNTPDYLTMLSLQTDRRIFAANQARSPDTYVDLLKQQLEASRELSPILAKQGSTSYFVDANDPAIAPYIAHASNGNYSYVLLPQDFIVLADGRIGAPIKFPRPGGAGPSTPGAAVTTQPVTFLIFAKVDGKWLVDETVRVCTVNCDQYFKIAQAKIDVLSGKSHSSTPLATATTAIGSGMAHGDNQRSNNGNVETVSPSLSPSAQSATPAGSATPAAIFPTPNASATAQASDCVVRTLTADEVKKLTADLLAAPAPTFLPAKGTAPESEASAAITTYTGAFSCRLNADQPADFNTFNLWSDRFFAETRLQYPTENRIVMQERRLAASRQLSPVLIDQDPTHYIIDTGDPAMQPYILQSPFGGNKYALLPKDFVVMADGRIGAPLKWAVPGGTTGYTKDDYTTPQSIPFLFFANVDGHWLLDQQINLCTWKCDQFYANEQAKIDRDRKWIAGQKQSTPAGTATPAASDPWIKPVTAAECTMPDTSGLSESELIAATSRWYLACGNERNNVQNVIPFFSSELLARHPELLKGQYTLQAADIESAKAVSSALTGRNLQILVQGIAGADDNSTRTSGFYEVFLPANAVVLPDGRIAIPSTVAIPDPDKFARATSRLATDPKAPQAAAALVFMKDGDTWKVDEFGIICLANCDGVWNEQETHIGTPSPSNDELATATAEAAKRLPIPPASCAVPSATASASDLPDRGYNRIMLPTTGKADAASGAARNVIACIAGEPTSATPGSSLQPLMTNRLQQEFAAGRGEPALTSVQIDGARSISAYLEQQKTYKPYERAAEGANATPPAVSPAHLVGGSDNPTFGWYPIVLPENAIQFPDGRIGVPLTLMITSDDLWKHLASELSSQSNIYIFSLADGTWQLDEVLPLCLGNCDAFWQEAMGTPASIGEEASLQPITPDDCAVPAPDTGAQPQLSSRAYRPVSVPDPSDSKAIVSTARDYLACSRYSTGNSLDPFMTDRFQTQLQGALANHGSSFLTQEDITAGKNLSAELAGGQGGYQFYVRGLSGADDTAAATQGFYEVVLPDNALLLPDGRIAMPITQAYTSDSGLKEAQASMSSVVSQTPYTVNVIIFAPVAGAWKVDQQLPLCLQNCSDFWQQREAQLATPSASPPATASPAAAIRCVTTKLTDEQVAQMVADFRRMPTPEYVPTKGVANDSDAKAAISSFQSLVSCKGPPDVPAQREINNMETNRLVVQIDLASTPATYADLLARDLANTQKLSPVLVESNPAQYIVDQNDLGDGMLIPGVTTSQGMATVLYPEDFVVLADGRIGAPFKKATPGGSGASSSTTYRTPQTVEFIIFKQENGRWLFDEDVTLCTANCEQYVQIREQRIENLRSQSTPASRPVPIASPAALDSDHRRA